MQRPLRVRPGRVGEVPDVAWFRADADDGTVDRLLCHLERAFCDLLGDLTYRPWTSVDAMAAALESCRAPVHLVIDDAHLLEGTGAAAALCRLVEVAPPAVTLVVAARAASRSAGSTRSPPGHGWPATAATTANHEGDGERGHQHRRVGLGPVHHRRLWRVTRTTATPR